MGRPSRYAPEVRERAVRMVAEHQGEYASQWAATASIAAKIGCTPETLRRWVRQTERDMGQRGGLTKDGYSADREHQFRNHEHRHHCSGFRNPRSRFRNWCSRWIGISVQDGPEYALKLRLGLDLANGAIVCADRTHDGVGDSTALPRLQRSIRWWWLRSRRCAAHNRLQARFRALSARALRRAVNLNPIQSWVLPCAWRRLAPQRQTALRNGDRSC